MTDNEGLYHFDGNANDTSGNNRNGTVSGATQVAGRMGSHAYSFDGSNDFINMGANFAFATSDFTFALWMKVPSSSQSNYVKVFSSATGSTGQGFIFEQNLNVVGRYRFQTGNGSSWQANGTYITLPTDTWSHVVLTRVGTVLKGYVNGAHVYTDNVPTTIVGMGDFYIGRFITGGYWAGEIDEFAVWSRALSAAEVADIYSKQTQVASTSFVDLGQTSSGTATLYPDNGASTPVNMANNGALLHFNNNTTDTSGNGLTVTTNDTSFATGFDGTANGSLAFNASLARATLSSPVSLSGNYTIAFWFYNLRPKNGWRTGVHSGEVTNEEWPIIVENGSDRLGMYIAGGPAFRPSGFNMPSGTYQGWHHIVAVGSGTTTQFYVNGVSVGSSDRKGVSNIKYIGNQGVGTSAQQFADRIDEFAIWTRALSATEIANIYSLQSAGKVSITSSATFTPDVIGTYQAQFTAFRGDFVDTVTVSANIAEPSTGLPSRALGGNMVGPSTLAFGALRPGALLPGGK
jgi:hypothetical protein